MNNSIEAIITRTRQSFYSDGLWELLAGGILLLGSITILSSPEGNSGAIIFASGILVLFYLYTWIKKRYIYPRSGYAIYKEQGLKARLFTVLKRSIILFILVVIYHILHSPGQLAEHRWFVFIIGIFIGAGWAWQGVKVGLPRLLLLGITSILLGAALSPLLPLASTLEKSTFEILRIYFLFMGTIFLLTGGVTLRRYTRDVWQDQGDAS